MTAARVVHPAVRFVIEGDPPGAATSLDQAKWVAGMYAAGPDLGYYFDALAVRPHMGSPGANELGGDWGSEPGWLARS